MSAANGKVWCFATTTTAAGHDGSEPHQETPFCQHPEYTTSCCDASQKGGESGLICRYCFGPVGGDGMSLLTPAKQRQFRAQADAWRASH